MKAWHAVAQMAQLASHNFYGSDSAVSRNLACGASWCENSTKPQ